MIVRKTFKSGDSTAITIPAKYGIKPKTHMMWTKKDGKIILGPLIK